MNVDMSAGKHTPSGRGLLHRRRIPHESNRTLGKNVADTTLDVDLDPSNQAW